MAEQVYMRVQEVAEELGVSVPYAYKLIRGLNQELKQKGFIVIDGRIDHRFFHEKMYATCTQKEGNHEAIISPAAFDMVQTELAKRTKGGSRYSGVSIFSNKIKCAD